MKNNRMLVCLLVLVFTLMALLPGMTSEVFAESMPTPPSLFASGDVGDPHLFMQWSFPPDGWNTEWEVSLSTDMMNTALCGEVTNPENETSVDFARPELYSSPPGTDLANQTVYVGVRFIHATEWGVHTDWSNLYEVILDQDSNIEKVTPYGTSPPTSECPSSDSPDGKHEWETKVIKEPTCTETGLKSTSCKYCKKQGPEEEIPALGHKWERKVKKMPTSTEPGVSVLVCGRCGLEKDDSEAPIETEIQEWTKGTKSPATFDSDTPSDDFSHVKVDDEIVDESKYDVKDEEGSTTISFNPEFLETLPVGSHIVEIVSKTGSSSIYLLVIKEPDIEETQPSDDLPKTGESSGHYPWLALMFFFAGGLILLERKKFMSKQRD